MSEVLVLLADDHNLVRAGIHALLQDLPGVRVVAEADNGRDALQLVEATQPHLVFMDIGMKGMNGIEVTARVTRDFPHVRVVMLSMHTGEEHVAQALHAGAAGYLLKDAAPAELELALRAVMRGEVYLSPAVSRHVVAYLRRLGEWREAGEAPLPTAAAFPLTPRQREILQLVAEGYTTKEIAAFLKLSARTVETHRTQLMERLGIHDVAGLVRYAIRVGLISPDQ